MNDVLHMLFGAALVAIGVLASGLADRIRQLRLMRRDDARAAVQREPRAPRQSAKAESPPLSSDSGDVVAALVAAGYRKALATQAVAACAPREQLTLESWTAAALRRCAQGGAS